MSDNFKTVPLQMLQKFLATLLNVISENIEKTAGECPTV